MIDFLRSEKKGEQYYNFDKDNPDKHENAYDYLLTYIEVFEYINK